MLPTTQIETFLSPEELDRLTQLRLAPRRKFAGRMRGERLSRQKGVSLEFADYREYTTGDDLRHLDWNILARLGRPTIRTYQDEDDLAVYVLLDASQSMDFGRPSKFSVARQLSVALGFIGLCGQDRVTMVALQQPAARPLSGRSNLLALNQWASAVKVGATGSLPIGIQSFLRARSVRRGLVICITDGLDKEFTALIASIGARGHELLMIQVLSDFDERPDIEGDLHLIDSESGNAIDITAQSDVVELYRENLRAHNKSIEVATATVGGRYVFINTGEPAVGSLINQLRRVGMVG